MQVSSFFYLLPSNTRADETQVYERSQSNSMLCSVYWVHDRKETVNPKATWVTVYPDGDYEYANGLYYVVGSSVMGPMGPEALPYRKKGEAQALIVEKGGKLIRWSELNAEAITAQ